MTTQQSIKRRQRFRQMTQQLQDDTTLLIQESFIEGNVILYADEEHRQGSFSYSFDHDYGVLTLENLKDKDFEMLLQTVAKMTECQQ